MMVKNRIRLIPSLGFFTLLCNDQNSHSVYQLLLSEDLSTTKLVTVLGPASTLAARTKILQIEEGESSATLSTYAGSILSGNTVLLCSKR